MCQSSAQQDDWGVVRQPPCYSVLNFSSLQKGGLEKLIMGDNALVAVDDQSGGGLDGSGKGRVRQLDGRTRIIYGRRRVSC